MSIIVDKNKISDLIVDEQNGFHSGRSYEEHIFTLTCLVRNQFFKIEIGICKFY